MRVTRKSLIRIAKETAQERAYNDPDIIQPSSPALYRETPSGQNLNHGLSAAT